MTNIEAFVQPIFTSSFILFKNLNLNNDEILKEFEQLSYDTTFLDNECENRALRSNSIKILDEIKNGEKIKEKINSCLNVSIKEIWKYDVDHTIVNSWVTKTYPNCDSRLHNHKNFWLSAVYTLTLPKDLKLILHHRDMILLLILLTQLNIMLLIVLVGTMKRALEISLYFLQV